MQSPAHAEHQRRWHVLGAGALGGLFTAFLAEAGSPVTLLLRKHTGGQKQATLRLRRGERHYRYNVPVSSAGEGGAIHHLLVATKAGDVEPALAGIADRLQRHASVVLLGNGMGYQERLRQRWPEWRFTWGTTTEGAWREGPLALCHAGSGETLLGAPDQPAPPGWFDDWRHLGIRCRWDADILTALWRKLAINCAINPLTALHRCANGALLEPPLHNEVTAVCREIVTIGEAAGQKAAVAGLAERVDDVLRGTAVNRSSMLQDVMAGRGTEIDYLTGYLLRVASESGVEAPRNRALLAAVQRLTASQAR